MNFNLNKFVEDVARDNELCREFSKFEEMDEIYGYCKDMGIECSEDEFDESVSEYICSLDNSDYKMGKIDEDNLGDVSGGSLKGTFSKTLAVALSAITLGGSGFFGNANAGEVSKISNFANSSYKSEKVNSGKWSRTKKAISNFYNNHKKTIMGTALTLGTAVIAGVILYNNHKINNYKKELSSMSDENILKKFGEILPQDTKHKNSDKQTQRSLPEKKDKKEKEVKIDKKIPLKEEKKDKPLISSSQSETPKTVEEKSIETPKKSDISPTVIVDEKQSSIDANSVDDTKTSKSDKSKQDIATPLKQKKASSASNESAVDKKQSSINTNSVDDTKTSKADKSKQNTATQLKQEETLNTSGESKKSKETAIIGKEPEKPDTNHANHETEAKQAPSTADGTPKSSDKVEEESKIDQALKGADVQKCLKTPERARRFRRPGTAKPNRIGENIKARSETDDPPKEIAEPNDTTQERESPVYGSGMRPRIDLSDLGKAASNLRTISKKKLT